METVQGEVARHWSVLFWVRGGDKMWEHGNRELMRDEEGERKEGSGSKVCND